MLLHDYGRAAAPSPRVELRRAGKFVLIEDGRDQHLCLAVRAQAAFHAQILERFCQSRDLQTGRQGDHVTPPAGVQVLGGGRYDLDEAGLSLRLHGTSLGYGPFPRDGLRDKLLAIPGLRGYTIIVEPLGG